MPIGITVLLCSLGFYFEVACTDIIPAFPSQKPLHDIPQEHTDDGQQLDDIVDHRS